MLFVFGLRDVTQEQITRNLRPGVTYVLAGALNGLSDYHWVTLL